MLCKAGYVHGNILRRGTPCLKGEYRRKDYERRTRQTNHCRDSGFVQLPKMGSDGCRAARLQAAQCRAYAIYKHHRWMVTVVMTLLIYSRVS